MAFTDSNNGRGDDGTSSPNSGSDSKLSIVDLTANSSENENESGDEVVVIESPQKKRDVHIATLVTDISGLHDRADHPAASNTPPGTPLVADPDPTNVRDASAVRVRRADNRASLGHLSSSHIQSYLFAILTNLPSRNLTRVTVTYLGPNSRAWYAGRVRIEFYAHRNVASQAIDQLRWMMNKGGAGNKFTIN